MPFSESPFHSQQVTNEIDRVAIALPPNATFYSDQQYVAVAFDATPEAVVPEILGSSKLPFMAHFQIFSVLCSDRAIRTVDNSLIVNGKAVTPEQYLGVWRTALKQPLTPYEFTAKYGFRLVVALGGVLADLRGSRTHWTSSPFATFDDFETAYSERMTYLGDGRCFRLELDLSQENAVRDAFYGVAFLPSAGDGPNASTAIMLCPTDRQGSPTPVAPAAQGDLFTLTLEDA